MVFKNSQQNKIFKFFFGFSEEHRYYLIPAAYSLLVINAFSMVKKFNKNILIIFLGFTFGIVTFFIPPSQGWYYWIIPIFSFFYIKSNSRQTYAFWSLQVCYFLYFILLPNSDIIQSLSYPFFVTSPIYPYSIMVKYGFNTSKILDIIFTLLQTSILLNCYYLYVFGIKKYSNKKISSLPYFIGIGGDSGTGKTTLSNSICNLFNSTKTTVIRGDDMHKWERGDDNWKTFTHLNPKANELHNEFYLLNRLKMGQSILRRHYDHTTGKFTPSSSISPNNVMIFEGLHPFYIKKMRSLYDLKIYMSPSAQLQRDWKIQRDVVLRGHNQEKVIQQLKDRESDAEKYIKSQNQFSDIEFSMQPQNNLLEYALSVNISNDIHLEPLILKIEAFLGNKIQHNYNDNDTQNILLCNDLSSEDIEKIADDVIPNLDDLGIDSPAWDSGKLGFMQLFICYYISQQLALEYEI